MQTDLDRIRRLFEKKIGLNTALISDRSWKRMLKERMAVCGIDDFHTYEHRLVHSPIEFQEFVEMLVVQETWFFRDKGALDFLSEYAYKEWMPQSRSMPHTILSLPCSTGEEPYSIAMSLIDNGFRHIQVRIDAVDISKKALAKAETGEYSKNSFRTKDLEFRDRHFTKSPVSDAYIIDQAIRKRVHFSHGNLLDNHLPHGLYDVIFCRNLFIYLNLDAQKRGFEIIKNLLSPSGILFVSLAEAALARAFGFISISSNKVGAFKPGGAEMKHTPEIQMPLAKHLSKNRQAPIKLASMHAALESHLQEKKLPSLTRARQLADLGKLDEALKICQEYLKINNTEPMAYFLIGLIAHATGDEAKAEEYFLKTVYLDVDFYEALIYLSLLAEMKGEMAQADLFRLRAEKARKR